MGSVYNRTTLHVQLADGYSALIPSRRGGYARGYTPRATVLFFCSEEAHDSEGMLMNKRSARKAIMAEWEKLPLLRRQTEDQAIAFIFNLMNRRPELFQFKYRKNPVETIVGWLLPARVSTDLPSAEEDPFSDRSR
jgi:hypothetical protein